MFKNEEKEYINDLKQGKYQKYLEVSPNKFKKLCRDIIDLLPIFGDGEDEEMIRTLISKGFDINKKDYYNSDYNKKEPLVALCESRKYESILLFMRVGASLNTSQNLINTLICGKETEENYEIDSELFSIIKILVKNGAPIKLSLMAEDVLVDSDFENQYSKILQKLLNVQN